MFILVLDESYFMVDIIDNWEEQYNKSFQWIMFDVRKRQAIKTENIIV